MELFGANLLNLRCGCIALSLYLLSFAIWVLSLHLLTLFCKLDRFIFIGAFLQHF